MQIIIVLIFPFLTFACGQTDFIGGNSISKEKDIAAQPASGGDASGITIEEEEVEPVMLQDWNIGWQAFEECAGQDPIIAGDMILGNFARIDQLAVRPSEIEVELDKFANVYVHPFGAQCLLEQSRRDVVFVVDVSASMADNDPVDANGSCYRRQAIERIINLLGRQMRFSIATFTTHNNYWSQWFTLKDSTELDPTVANKLCEAIQYTNYTAGLDRAQNLLASSKASQREVYFISDGEPSEAIFYDVEPWDGKKTAAKLKADGVRIATLMLNGNDMVMEQFIASLDAKGKPLHGFANKADQVVSLLENLVNVKKIETKLSIFGYKAPGDKDSSTLLEDQVLTASEFGDDGSFIFDFFDVKSRLKETEKQFDALQIKMEIMHGNEMINESSGFLLLK